MYTNIILAVPLFHPNNFSMKNYFTGTNEEFPFFFFYSFFSQKKGHRCAYEERYRGDREGKSPTLLINLETKQRKKSKNSRKSEAFFRLLKKPINNIAGSS